MVSYIICLLIHDLNKLSNGTGNSHKFYECVIAVKERYERLREEMSLRDKEDKVLHRQRLREKRTKEKMKLKRRRGNEEEEEEDDYSEQDEEAENKAPKRSKIYFGSDDDAEQEQKKEKNDVGVIADSISVGEQEALALKLLSSMHS